MCFFAYKVAGYYYGGGYPVNNYGYNYNIKLALLIN